MANETANDISAMADMLEGKSTPQAPQQEQQQVQPPVQEQQPPAPVVETPAPIDPNKPIDNPTPEQPTFNLDAELEKISGGAIKTQADVAAIIERSNKAADFESKLSNLEKENNDLKAKVNSDPFANDFTKRLNELYKSGATDSQIQAFSALNKVSNLEGLSAVDARLLALQIKNGISEDEAKIYLNSQYKLDPDENDEQTIKSEEIRLKVDANADREFLRTHKAEVSKVPESQADVQQRELEQKQTEQVAKLQPIAKSVLQSAKDLFKGLSLNGKDGDQNVKGDFEATEQSIKSLEPLVENFIQSQWQTLTPDEKGQTAVKEFVENLLVIQNYKNMIINAASQRELQVRAEYNNPTPVNRGQDAPNPTKSSKEEFEQRLLNSY
jgi:hypothetical protein